MSYASHISNYTVGYAVRQYPRGPLVDGKITVSASNRQEARRAAVVAVAQEFECSVRDVQARLKDVKFEWPPTPLLPRIVIPKREPGPATKAVLDILDNRFGIMKDTQREREATSTIERAVKSGVHYQTLQQQAKNA